MEPKSIFITGASSGIGAALAKEYATPGITLGIAARRREKLQKLAEDCRAAGAQVWVYELDVTDGAACAAVAKKFLQATGHIDVLIANAGIGGWRHPADDTAEHVAEVVTTNVIGVTNIVMAFLPALQKQKSGQIVATSSIAAFARLPHGPYSATKIAIRYLMDGWRIDLATQGITCTTLYPGFIETEMTNRRNIRYPFYTSIDRAARAFRGAIDARRHDFIYPWQWRFLVPFAGFVPDWLWRRII